ncbi:MAG: GDP-L-fucose synthase [Planctomycetes bacterium]|nr:GDP-L-fucose synthase [Planctomycetota bacterium]
MDLESTTCLVTGGSGFLGRAVCRLLESRGATVIVPRSRDHDLRRREVVERLLSELRPRVVIHLAAVVGGIGANRRNPATYFYDNAAMALHVLDESYRAGVAKFVGVGTICSYPKFTPVPFRESDLWNGYPEETNAPYGLAKKMMLVQAQAYRAQHQFPAIMLLPTNLYGPGDHFDLESGHVIPSLIRKFVEARRRGDPTVTVWGTGTPTREFLHVSDAAEAIVAATESYDDGEPMNVGSGDEISIRALAELLSDLCGYRGALVFDASRPDGQPRRCVDATRARERIGFRARIPLRDGLIETIRWFEENEGRR